MNRIKTVFQILILLVALYTFFRIYFLFAYFSNEINISNLLTAFYLGLRLDASAIILVNLPLWAHQMFIDPFLKDRLSSRISTALLLICNLPFIVLNIIDLAYFHFTLR